MDPHRDSPIKQQPSWWTRGRVVAVAAGGIAATLIGVFAIVVPLAATAGEKQSSPQSVVAHDAGTPDVDRAIPAVSDGLMAVASDVRSDSRLTDSDWYAVPIDAPWDELWALPPVCTSTDIVDWIAAHGEPMLPQSLDTTLQNVATSGDDAVVSNIRAEGELTVPDRETVVVGGMKCRGAGDDGVFASMVLGVDPVAVFDACYDPWESTWSCAGQSTQLPQPGDPVVFSLAPGQATTLHLKWTQSFDFIGRFVADVTVGGQTQTLDLSPGGADIVVPWVTYPDRRLYFGGEGSTGAWCEDASGRTDECTVDSWTQMIGRR